jgi:hypothetical protein
MGSPLSPVLCNLFLEYLESLAISSFTMAKPVVFARYMDDICFVWPQRECEIKLFHEHLNKQEERIQFTIKLENEGKIPFLDVLISRKKGRLVTEVYRKPTNSY